jgi:hypothetical protein
LTAQPLVIMAAAATAASSTAVLFKGISLDA